MSKAIDRDKKISKVSFDAGYDKGFKDAVEGIQSVKADISSLSEKAFDLAFELPGNAKLLGVLRQISARVTA
jgi:hypothetical protein